MRKASGSSSRSINRETVATETGQAGSSRVAEEAQRLAFLVLVRAEQNVTAARFYENVHFSVGAIAAGLAATAGGTAFAGQTIVAGVAAVLSAVLTGFLTVHRPEERTASHWRAARDYSRLYDVLTLYFTVGWKPAVDVLDSAPPPRALRELTESDTGMARGDNAEEALAKLVRRAGEIEEASFPVASRLCRKAESNIARQDEWIAPAGDDFAAWRTRLMRSRTKRRWRLRRRDAQ